MNAEGYAILAAGGTVLAWRLYPSPFHYSLVLHGALLAEISEDDIAALLREHRIHAPSVKEIGADTYPYHVGDRSYFHQKATRHLRFGFGRCAVCGRIPLAMTNMVGIGARHGPRAAPCEGSGKHMLDLVRA